MIPAHERCEDKYQELLAAKRKRRKPREEEAEFVDIPPHVNRERIAKLQRAEAIAEAKPQPDDTPDRAAVMKKIADHYRKHGQKLMEVWGRRMKDQAAGEDAVHAGYLRCIENWHDAEVTEAWLGQVITNGARNSARDERLRRNSQADIKHLENEGSGEDIEKNVIINEVMADIQSKIKSEPPHLQQVFDLYFWEQWTMEEVAVFTGKPVSTIKSLVARFRIKHGLKEGWGG